MFSPQLGALTTLAEERFQPTIDEIYDVLCTAGGEEGSYGEVDDQARQKLGRFYETLEAADMDDHQRLRWLVKSDLNAVKRDLRRLRIARNIVSGDVALVDSRWLLRKCGEGLGTVRSQGDGTFQTNRRPK